MQTSTKSKKVKVIPHHQPEETEDGIPYLSQAESARVDAALMELPGFSEYQLMELAGLSVAQSIFDAYGKKLFRSYKVGNDMISYSPKVLVLAGPGNNGGDALVTTRHLKHFGFSPVMIYPKRPKKELFQDLMAQTHNMEIPMYFDIEPDINLAAFDLIVDGVFGYSFNPKGGIRAPFDALIKEMVICQGKIPIVSIDFPSGWDVDLGPDTPDLDPTMRLNPDMLVSLTAPKPGSKYFKGEFHYLGGRFLTAKIIAQFGLERIDALYKGCDQFVRLK